MLEFAIIQVLSICFAVLCAIKDWIPVVKFQNYGVTKEEMRIFHLSGGWIRFTFCAAISGVAYPDLTHLLLYFSASGLWVYLLFDIVLSVLRGLKWWYIGTNDDNGAFWLRWMGKYAGIYKAVILLIMLLVTNLFFVFHIYG